MRNIDIKRARMMIDGVKLTIKDNTLPTSQGLILNAGDQMGDAINLWIEKGNSIYSKGNYKSGRV